MKTFTTYFKALLIACCLFGLSETATACTAGFTYTLGPNGAVSFSSTSSPTTALDVYSWQFGNGVWTSYTAVPTANTTYTANGIYWVTLTFFTTSPTCSAVISQSIVISNAVCGLNTLFTYVQGANGLVNFSSACTGTVPGTTYLWKFGDNTTSTSLNPSHTYAANGYYFAQLIANNNFSVNCVDSTWVGVWVTSYCTINASFSYTQGPNGQLYFASTSTGTIPPNSFSWNFGNLSTGTGTSAPQTFTNGTYTVALTVSNNFTPACVSTATQVITVTSNTCFLVPGFNQTIGLAGIVNFASTSTGTNLSTTYNWNLGNGFTSTSPNPITAYLNGGTHLVSFTVSNGPNCKFTLSSPITITTVPCTANANFALSLVSPLYWTATPAYPYNVVQAKWSWGNGNISNQLYASNGYSFAGMYNICLQVTVSCGATASACASYSIYKGAAAMININAVEPTTTLLTTGIAGIDAEKEIVYEVSPNPSDGTFVLNLEGLKGNMAKVKIIDITGKVHYQAVNDSPGGTMNEKVKMNDLGAGIYFVHIESGGQAVTKKIIITK